MKDSVENAKLKEYLELIFQNGIPWDYENKYKLDNIAVFIEVICIKVC